MVDRMHFMQTLDRAWPRKTFKSCSVDSRKRPTTRTRPLAVCRASYQHCCVLDTDVAFIAGSGLGLWISKQISTQMGGKIEVDSEFGKGCSE